ncbi:hypothetical protein E2C01_028348 [Portunus trituberculatus]|uniref:Uncharacterized protein n=1 Tax=Portunus trituberculatus TaxID=210409 RepID=A0A5B7ERF0_PORTR|nr:hypothetical protein [Portunus trituberculatus]
MNNTCYVRSKLVPAACISLIEEDSMQNRPTHVLLAAEQDTLTHPLQQHLTSVQERPQVLPSLTLPHVHSVTSGGLQSQNGDLLTIILGI